MKSATNPNLFIVGAPKCGTTFLSTYLANHPEVFVCEPKEPNFWSFDLSGNPDPNGVRVSSLDEYRCLFEAGRLATYRCDASTSYLWSSLAVGEIAKSYPTAKYIVMIRNPIDLAISLHKEQVHALKEREQCFQEAWRRISARLSGKEEPSRNCSIKELDYRWCASLGTQIKLMLQKIDRERVHFISLDEVKNDPRGVYLATLEFLRLEDDGQVDFNIVNQSKRHRSQLLARFLLAPNSRNLARLVYWMKLVAWRIGLRGVRSGLIKALTIDEKIRVDLSNDFRKELESTFKDEVLLIAEHTGKDVSHSSLSFGVR